jgi:hypothetical protein
MLIYHERSTKYFHRLPKLTGLDMEAWQSE